MLGKLQNEPTKPFIVHGTIVQDGKVNKSRNLL